MYLLYFSVYLPIIKSFTYYTIENGRKFPVYNDIIPSINYKRIVWLELRLVFLVLVKLYNSQIKIITILIRVDTSYSNIKLYTSLFMKLPNYKIMLL